MRLALTDRFCSSAKSAHAAQTDYFDETAVGLALRVSETGHKGWSFHFTNPMDGKRGACGLAPIQAPAWPPPAPAPSRRAA